MPVRRLAWRGHLLAEELRERIRGLRTRLDGLVDGGEGGRDIEGQAEHRLARGPHDAPDAMQGGRREDVVRGEGVVAEGLALGVHLGCRDGRQVDHGVRAADDVVALAKVGQVDGDRRAVGSRTPHAVDVEDVVSLVAKLGQHPAASLAGASRDDDAHGQMMAHGPAQRSRRARRCARSQRAAGGRARGPRVSYPVAVRRSTMTPEAMAGQSWPPLGRR